MESMLQYTQGDKGPGLDINGYWGSTYLRETAQQLPSQIRDQIVARRVQPK
ncbi:hypothetical protein BFJ69_g6284 [Fusarium oxysporum]|uniref:Uncharacterized protein n=1 Tax=Fusarium oxysporum TaxID=5507 RepID=A0A420NAI8_FUSOX|nr:hypothetical protein BFJ69_g6284 [Fusarium oxysporum]